MRLCIIGNSHLGCVKKAGRSTPSSKGFRPTFFGAPGNTMQGARLTGDTIFPPNEYTTHFRVMSGGLDRVRLEDYDAFLLVGLSLATEHACSAYKTHRLAQHARSGEFLISEACLEKAVDGSVTTSAAYYIARLIKSVRNAPILILPKSAAAYEYPGQARRHVMDRRGYQALPLLALLSVSAEDFDAGRLCIVSPARGNAARRLHAPGVRRRIPRRATIDT